MHDEISTRKILDSLSCHLASKPRDSEAENPNPRALTVRYYGVHRPTATRTLLFWIRHASGRHRE